MGTLVSRLADNHASRRPLRHPKLWAAVTIVTLIVGIAVYVSFSSAFHLQQLEVKGTSHLTRRGVLELSGLTRRTNVVWLDTGAVEQRLESDPWVASAIVSKVFPRTIRIQVTEREPVAAIPGYGGFRLIAADGTSLAVVRARPYLPLIIVPPARVTRGSGVDAAAPARAVAGLDPKLRSRVDSVVASADGFLVLNLTNGVRVEYGDATQVAAKGRLIASILRWASAHGRSLATVNVTAPDAPAASFAS